MPERLRRMTDAQERAAGQPPLPALRVWTTLLCVCCLRRLDESFLLKTVDRDGFEETIVDRAMEWLAAMARRPRLLPARHLSPLALHAVWCTESAGGDLVTVAAVTHRLQGEEYENLREAHAALYKEAEDFLVAWETRHVRGP